MRAWPLLILLAGCGPMPNLDVDPRVQLGTGEIGFEPIGPGAAVPVISGLQGGQHIWGSARAIGLDWREVTAVFSLLDEDGDDATEPTTVQLAMNPCPANDGACEDGMGETVGITVLVDRLSSVVGEDITMQVVVEDGAGRQATAGVPIEPFWDPE